jgi:hypothetical protein
MAVGPEGMDFRQGRERLRSCKAVATPSALPCLCYWQGARAKGLWANLIKRLLGAA